MKTKIHENSDLNPEVMKPEENSDTKWKSDNPHLKGAAERQDASTFYTWIRRQFESVDSTKEKEH